MSTTAPSPRPAILGISPYVGGESKVEGVARVIRLASNESALGPSPRAIEAYRAAAGEMHRYPDGNSAALREVLARQNGIDAKRIVCGGGSDDLIHILASAYSGPGDEVIYSRHGFLIYPIAAHTAGATVVVAPERDYRFDVDAVLARVTAKTRIVFIANPNNPTGTYISVGELRRLQAGLPSSVLLVIDAAYAEYAARNDYEPGFSLVEACENVVMLRTFSKIYAMGGLRLGWAYAPDAIVDVMNRIRNPFNVSSAAQAAGIAALEDKASLDRARAHNDTWKPWFERELQALGIGMTDSAANFVLARFGDAKGAFEYLKSRGILTRRVAAYHLPEHLRITIGTEDEMREVVSAIKTYLAKT